MLKRRQKAQLEISFGVIFSIIIIIAVLAIAGYVIVRFLSVDYNVECKLFYSEMQKKIDESWGSGGSVSYVFSHSVPGKTEKVCFGYTNQSLLSTSDEAAYDDVALHSDDRSNLFFYPSGACGDTSFSYQLKHATTDKFFCVSVQNGKANLKISKDRFDALVKLNKL